MPTPPPKLKCRNRNHTDSRFWNPLIRPESIRRTRCVHALVRTQGPIATEFGRWTKAVEPRVSKIRRGAAMSAIALTLGVPAQGRDDNQLAPRTTVFR